MQQNIFCPVLSNNTCIKIVQLLYEKRTLEPVRKIKEPDIH
jgi:hypothetical protein